MRELTWAGGVAFACLVVYVFSWSTSISLVDAGLFHLVCQDNGIAHPPGYPLATLLCHPFMSLPLPGTLPGNLFSTLFGFATLVVFFYVARTLTLEPLWAALATFSLGLALSFWSQSIVIEVYTLNTFLFALAFLGTLRYLASGRDGWLIGAFLAFAFALSNHWPIIMLSALAFLPLLAADLPKVRAVFARPGLVLTMVACLLLGLSPYLLILLKPFGGTSMIGNVSDFADLWRLVSRQTYGDSVIESVRGSQEYLLWLPVASIGQLGALAWVLVPVGAYASFRQLPSRFALSLMVLWLANVSLLPLLSNYVFDESLRALYVTWTLVGLFSCAIWLSLGLRLLLSNYASIQSVAVIAVIAAIGMQNLSRLGARDAAWVEEYNRLMLASLKEDAVLFVAGDVQTGPVGYLHHVQGVRPDIEVRHEHNILFANRLVEPDLPSAVQQEAIARFLDHTERPVYSISGLGRPSVDYGLYYELADKNGFSFLPELDLFMSHLIPVLEADLIREPFIRLYLHKIVYDYARAVIGESIFRSGFDEPARKRLLLVVSTLQGKIWTLHHLLRGDNEINLEQLRSLIEAGEAQVLESPVETGAGEFLRLAADAYQEHLGDPDKAANHYGWARTFDIRGETCRHLETSSRPDLAPGLGC